MTRERSIRSDVCLDGCSRRSYISSMGMILTLQEQRLAGDAADKVGGYSELIRLERERRRAKGKGHVTKDGASGRFIFSASGKPKG